ncbi:hypothetical protein D3C80_1153680 [compost metagenome]
MPSLFTSTKGASGAKVSFPAIILLGSDLLPAASSATTLPPASLVNGGVSFKEKIPSLFAVTVPNTLLAASYTVIFALASALPVTNDPSALS